MRNARRDMYIRTPILCTKDILSPAPEIEYTVPRIKYTRELWHGTGVSRQRRRHRGRRSRRELINNYIMATALLRCMRCTKAADTAVEGREESELRPFTGEDGNEEESREAWENWRRILVAALLLVMSFFVASAYSLLGSFFPIEVWIVYTHVYGYKISMAVPCKLYSCSREPFC